MFSCGGCTGRLLAGAIRAEGFHIQHTFGKEHVLQAAVYVGFHI